MYYRKLNSQKKYYPIVKHRSRIHHDSTCSCGEEDILGGVEPEDTIIPDIDYPGKWCAKETVTAYHTSMPVAVRLYY